MRYLLCGVVIVLCLCAGCARFPTNEAVPATPSNILYSSITVAGSINASYYYFLALNNDQTNATGPVPVVTGFSLSNGWGTIYNLPANVVKVPPIYVEINNNSFSEYVVYQSNNQPTYLGPPYAFGLSSSTSSGNLDTLWVEIDLNQIGSNTNPAIAALLGGPTLPYVVQVNWITLETLDTVPGQTNSQVDGFGPYPGNNYLDNVSLLTNQPWQSGVGTVPSQPSSSSLDPDIDLTNWVVKIQIKPSTPPVTTSSGEQSL